MTPTHTDAARAEIMEILRTRMGTVYTSKGTLMDTADALLAFVQQREYAYKTALGHARYLSHDYQPNACGGCADVERLLHPDRSA